MAAKDHMGDSEENSFSKKQVKLAVAALLAHCEDEKKKVVKKDELFSQNDYLWMLIGFRKVPQIDSKPRKIPLPHPIHNKDEICLISKEPGKVLKEKLLEKGVTNIKKVISLTKLRKNYKTFALKRELASTYDLFLCDERIYHLASKTLGKEFFKRKKEPLPIRLTYPDWKTEISKTVNSTLLRMGHGPCSAVKVGCLSEHTEKELMENVTHAVSVCVKKVPGSWKNIKSIYIKTSTSVSLPVYQASPLAVVQIDGIDGVGEEPKRKKSKKTAQPTEVVDKEAAKEAEIAGHNDDNDDDGVDDEVTFNDKSLKNDIPSPITEKPKEKKKKKAAVSEKIPTRRSTRKSVAR